MNREEYLSSLEKIKKEMAELEKKKSELKEQYIRACKPCEVDDLVEIVRYSGLKTTGQAKTFRILQDSNVYVDSVNIGKSKKVYFSQPYKSLKVIKDKE
jgi:hypothetical protein